MTRNSAAAKVIRLSDRKKSDKSDFCRIEEIQVAHENNYIYNAFGVENADDWSLVVSIKEKGVQEPVVTSRDCVLLSGHRRVAAVKHLGIPRISVRRVDVVFGALSKAERLEVLRVYNQQRAKDPGELIREQMLDIDPDEAYSALIRRRLIRQFSKREGSIPNVDLGTEKKRARITTLRFLQAAQDVIEANREYWPLTLRRVHYLLLNNPPLKHDKKPDSYYGNDRGSYQALANLLIRARLADLVPMEAIEDSTRPIQLGGGFSAPEQFIRQEAENFLLGYSRNLMQGQPHHLEIMLEKNALRSIIERVAREFCVPVTTGKGFSSLSPRYDLWERFRQSGKRKLVLLMLTDFDPDGQMIASSFARSMRDDFGLRDIDAVKVALTSEDVRDNNLPSDLDAKPTSPNYAKFVAEFGTQAVELDAAPVELLQDKLRRAIESAIDVDEFNGQIALEKTDAPVVAAYRKAVLQAIGSQQ